MLNVLFIGDISTRVGRNAVKDLLPEIRKKHKVDLVVANAENAAGGRGVTREIVDELGSSGVDYFTTGEHVWDIPEFRMELQDRSMPLVRPLNYEAEDILQGKGWDIIDLGSKGKVIVLALLGQVFMRDHVRSPFWVFDEWYEKMKTSIPDFQSIPIIIDLHCEATSEKIAFAWYVKERAAAVLGTHTHVGTIDTRILEREDFGKNNDEDKNKENGCAFVSDVGMCGPYNASLWVDFEPVIHNYKYPFKQAFKEAKGRGSIFNSVLIEINQNFAEKITRIDRITR